MVALGLIILASSIVVFFLLRNQKGGGRGRGHVSTFSANREGGFPAQGGLRNLFGRSNQDAGWRQQLDDEHDFDSESEDGFRLADSSHHQRRISLANSRARDLPQVPSIKPLPPLSHDINMASVSSVSLQAPGLSSATDLAIPQTQRSRSSSPKPPTPQRKETMESMHSVDSQYSRMSGGTKFHEHIDF